MANITLNPYLFFNGNCKDAMEFYKSVFGGNLDISLYDDAPGDMPGKDEMKGKVLHAKLDGGDAILYACDSNEASPKAAKVELALGGSDEERLHKIFDNLSESGNVKLPLEKQFWGDTFGMVNDKFGIDWMINITS